MCKSVHPNFVDNNQTEFRNMQSINSETSTWELSNKEPFQVGVNFHWNTISHILKKNSEPKEIGRWKQDFP